MDDDVNVQTAIRLPTSLIDGVDEYAERLRRRTPGIKITRSDAVRMLLLRGLEEATRRARSGDV